MTEGRVIDLERVQECLEMRELSLNEEMLSDADREKLAAHRELCINCRKRFGDILIVDDLLREVQPFCVELEEIAARIGSNGLLKWGREDIAEVMRRIIQRARNNETGSSEDLEDHVKVCWHCRPKLAELVTEMTDALVDKDWR